MNYYPKNIGDYLTKTLGLTMLQEGAYNRMIDLYYSSEKPLPLDKKEIYASTRCASKSEREAVDFVLAKYFTEESDGFHQSRCDEELIKYFHKSAKASESASARWAKDLSERNANASNESMRTHSDGSANGMLNNIQETINNKQNQETKKKNTATATAVACPDGVSESVWNDYLAIRKNKRLPLTATAWKQLQIEINSSGLTAEQALRECCLRGWAGFKANWITRDQNQNTNFRHAQKDPLEKYASVMLPVSDEEIAEYEAKINQQGAGL